MENLKHQSKMKSIFFYCLLLLVMGRFLLVTDAVLINHLYHLNISFKDLFIRLDSRWYLGIVYGGYEHAPLRTSIEHHANYVFFPMLPLIIKALAVVTRFPPYIAGLIVSNGFFLLASCLFYRLLEEEFDTESARVGVFLLCFNPYNVYFTAIYTESLFLTFSIACWLAAKHRSWWLLGLAGFCMTATRPNGIIIFIFALWFAFADYRKYKEGLLQYLPILLIPLSLLLYMVYLHVHTGDALAFVHNQAEWVGRTGWHVHGFFKQLHQRLQFMNYNIGIGIFGLALSGFLAWKGYYKEALFLPLMILPGVISGSFVSLARFSATLFTFYFAIVLLLRYLKWQREFLFYFLFITLMIIATNLFIFLWLKNSWLVF